MAKQTKSTGNSIRPLMALTVGGAPQPLAFSISRSCPSRVIFFASPESANSITLRGEKPDQPGQRDTRGILQILEELKTPLTERDFAVVTVPAQKLLPCVEEMRRVLAEEFDKAGDGTPLVLDFTGGTKLMSAALALAGQRYPNTHYIYIGAKHGSASRDKGGLGVTRDGEEMQLTLDNPRDVSSFGVIEDALLLCRSGAWRSAARLLEAHRHRLTDLAKRREIEAWTHLCTTYDEWDRLLYREARKSLAKCRDRFDRLKPHLTTRETESLRKTLEDHATRLEQLSEGGDPEALCLDLIANADRRAKNDQFDEAAQRLYRVVEVYGRHLLESQHGINPSDPEFRKLPRAFTDQHDLRPPRAGKKIPLGLQKIWDLLGHLGDPAADRFGELKLTSGTDSKAVLLGLRNSSILVHGNHRVTSRECNKLRYHVCRLLDVDDEALTAFPVLRGRGE